MTNLKMDLFKILQVVIINFLVIGVHCEPQCCPNNGTIKDERVCQNGTKVQIKCDEYPIMMNNNWGSYNQYITARDQEGDYLDAYGAGYMIRSPYFCVGPMNNFRNVTRTVAITCSSFRTWYGDQNLTINEKAKSELRRDVTLKTIVLILNSLSSLILLAIAAIYYFLPEAQDLQGICYFHFTLLAGLGHGSISYIVIFETKGLLPNLCITNAYLLMYLIITVFMWMLVISYNTWRQTSNRDTEDEGKLLKKYKLFAYGTSAAIGFFSWVHIHISHFSESDEFFVLDCWTHEYNIIRYFMLYPIFVTTILNFLLFVDCQRRLWNHYSIQVRDKKLMIKVLKYRMFMNAKLFFLMGMPYILFLIQDLIASLFEFGQPILQFITLLCIYSEGIPIFIILVFSRKRILRGLINRWFKEHTYIPENWRTTKDSETEEEIEEVVMAHNNANFEVRYNNSSDETNKTDNRSSIVTNLLA